MSNILIGIFRNQPNYKQIELDLESNGFSDNRYIVYLDGESNEQYLVGTEVNDDVETAKAELVYHQNNMAKKYLLYNMDINEATNYEEVKKRLRILANAEIQQAAGINIKSGSSGINSEVKA